MTLPSRKKHQITRPSTTAEIISDQSWHDWFSVRLETIWTERLPARSLHRWFSVFAVGCALATTSTFAAEQPVGSETQVASPLSRLQQRSADERWREAREQWIPMEADAFKDSTTPPRAMPGAMTPQQSDVSASSPSRSTAPATQPVGDSGTSETTSGKPGNLAPATTGLLQEEEGPLSLFEFSPGPGSPFPPASEPLQLDPTAPLQSVDYPAAKSPGGDASDLASPARNIAVPDPYAADIPKAELQSAQQRTSVPGPLPFQLQRAQDLSIPGPATAPGTGTRLAQLGELPPAPSAQIKQPTLKSIRDIQPFHEYQATPVDRIPAMKPLQADTGPDFLDLPLFGELDRDFQHTYYQWLASNLKHNPLYFEDVALERYGHTYSDVVQPFVSVSKFGVQAIGLPYQFALNAAWDEQYALGHYRPGECAPPLRYKIPFNKDAALTAAGVYTGLIFLIP